VLAAEPLARRYWLETRALVASRLRTASAFFLVFGCAISSLDLVYFPQRTFPLLLVCAGYVAVCAAAVLLVQQAPRWTFPVTALATNALALSMAAYLAQVDNRAEMLVLALVLFLKGGLSCCSPGACAASSWAASAPRSATGSRSQPAR